MTSKTSQIFASAIMALSVTSASAATITFEGLLRGAGAYNNNAGASGAFTTGGVSFSNSYSATYGSWTGFAISNTTDTTTAGYGNQYSAYPGSGAGGSATYAMSYSTANVKFATPQNLLGASITNATYAGLSMQTGDMFAKKFGGASGNDADFFKLTISGFAGGIATGTPVDFFLADFRFANNSQDYIVNQWTFVDFSPLGAVDEIRFSYASSDTSVYDGVTYPNTPTFFALDNLVVVPEPSAAALGLLGCLGLLNRRRR